jgi:hypothetical protein
MHAMAKASFIGKEVETSGDLNARNLAPVALPVMLFENQSQWNMQAR